MSAADQGDDDGLDDVDIDEEFSAILDQAMGMAPNAAPAPIDAGAMDALAALARFGDAVEPPEAEAEEAEELKADTAEAVEARRRRAVFEAMTEQQLNRYEAFVRAKIKAPSMKKLVSLITGHAPSDKLIIALCSTTKMFLGDIVERARAIASEHGHSGALLPCHVRQAYQQLDWEGRVPHRAPPKRLLR